jgi:hypothetical protein
MTEYLRSANAQAGDELVFTKDENHSFEVAVVRLRAAEETQEGVLVLSGGWKIVNF